MRVTLLLLVLLSFFERPAWCDGKNPAPEYYLMSGMAVLGVPVVLVLDWLGLSILLVEVALIITYQGFHRWRQGRGQGAASPIYTIVLLLQLLDLLVATCFWAAVGEEALQPMRFAPFLRLLLLIIQSEQLRLQFVLINRTLPVSIALGPRPSADRNLRSHRPGPRAAGPVLEPPTWHSDCPPAARAA